MSVTAKNRKRTATKGGSSPAKKFPPGSLEAELSAIGRSVPAAEWSQVPPDYFANLDRYQHEEPDEK